MQPTIPFLPPTLECHDVRLHASSSHSSGDGANTGGVRHGCKLSSDRPGGGYLPTVGRGRELARCTSKRAAKECECLSSIINPSSMPRRPATATLSTGCQCLYRSTMKVPEDICPADSASNDLIYLSSSGPVGRRRRYRNPPIVAHHAATRSDGAQLELAGLLSSSTGLERRTYPATHSSGHFGYLEDAVVVPVWGDRNEEACKLCVLAWQR